MFHSTKRITSLMLAALLILAQLTALADSKVYTGQNDHGVGGTIRVEVTMDGETISKIKTVEQKETRGLGTTAIMQLTKDIVEKNSLEVDLVSGATLSSIAFLGAVRQAVEKAAAYDPAASVELGENEYLGISNNGLGGRLMVKVKVEDGKITAIDVLEAYESEEIGVAALNTQIEKMVASGSAEADVITGATITCNALNEAVSEALASSQK